MRNLLGLKVETKLSLVIILIVACIFLITVFKSLDNFNKFMDKINKYQSEEIKIDKSK
ncbi:hypothetical protein KJ684_00400 [Patescibacteria group bacterium]|nr:hypothetical protein [Patescibacteria group bacterium]